MKRRSKVVMILLMKSRADISDPMLGDFEGFCERLQLFEFYKFMKMVSFFGFVKGNSVMHRLAWFRLREGGAGGIR